MSDWNVFVTFEESDIGQKTRRRTPGCQTGKFPPLYREVRPPPLLSTVTWGEDNFNIFVIRQPSNSSSILFPLFFCKNSPDFLSSPLHRQSLVWFWKVRELNWSKAIITLSTKASPSASSKHRESVKLKLPWLSILSYVLFVFFWIFVFTTSKQASKQRAKQT